MLMARHPDDNLMAFPRPSITPLCPSPTSSSPPGPCLMGATTSAAALLAVQAVPKVPQQPMSGTARTPTSDGAAADQQRNPHLNAAPHPGTAPTESVDSGADGTGTVSAAVTFGRYAEAKHALPGRLQARAVLAEADRLFPTQTALRNLACISVLVRVLLGGAPDAVAAVTAHRALLQRFTDADPVAQTEALAAVAGVLTARPELVRKTEQILKYTTIFGLSDTATSYFWDHLARVPSMPPAPRRVMYPTCCLCLLGADWYLQSDVVPIPVFRQLFDDDIIEEPAFLLWDAANYQSDCGPAPTPAPVAVDVRRRAARFVSWLRTAEEEEDSDDDDDETEIAFQTATSDVEPTAIAVELNIAATDIAEHRRPLRRCGKDKKVSFCDDPEIFIVPGPKDESRYGSWAADGIRERIGPPW